VSDQPVNLMDPEETDNSLGWFTGTVIEDFFSTPAEESGGKATFQGADRWTRYWKVKIEDVHQDWDYDLPENNIITVQFSLGGENWFPTDESNTAVRHKEDTGEGRPRTFDLKSKMGQLLGLINGKRQAWKADEVIVMDGGDVEVEYDMTPCAAYFAEQEFTDPRQAGIFNGTRWLFRGLGMKYNPRKGETERDVRSKPHPVQFLGTSDTPLEPTATKPGGPEVDQGILSEILFGADTDLWITEEVVENVAQLLRTATNHSQFARNVIAAYPELQPVAMDKANGLWSARH
jgi:hypothetical protein